MKKTVLWMLCLLPWWVAAQGIEKLQQKASQGDAKAMVELAAYYECGQGVKTDSARALQLYQEAYDQHRNADALAHIAWYEYSYSGLQHDSVRCLDLSRKSHEMGASVGTYNLAKCYAFGIGTQRDLQQARALLERSAARGYHKAISRLSANYYYGAWGYQHDVPQAVKWAKKEKEHVGSSSGADLLYRYYLAEADTAAAIAILKRSAEHGNVLAMTDLVLCTFQGIGTEENEYLSMQKAEELLQRLPGESHVLAAIGMILSNATDTSLRDNDRWLRCMEQSEYYATIGYDYYTGRHGLPTDSLRAVHYLRRGMAIHEGESFAMMARLHFMQGNTDSMLHYAQQGLEWQSEDCARVLAEYYISQNDLAEGERYAVLAADWGDEDSRQLAASIANYSGDLKRAEQHLQRAIANQHYAAYEDLSALRHLQKGEKAYVKTLEQGANKGNAECLTALGVYYMEQGDVDRAAPYLRRANTPKADYLLFRAAGSPAVSSSEGYARLRRSALSGYEDAAMSLCEHYEYAEEHPDSILYIARLLSRNGSGRGNLLMGYLHETGFGLPQNIDSAKYFYRLAGEADYSGGYVRLGDLLLQEGDSAAAYQSYVMASLPSMEEYFTGLNAVAGCQLNGIGCEKDTALAVQTLHQAVDAGSGRSAAVLGRFFNYGLGGLAADADSALYYYKLASDANVPEGDYAIGQYLYSEGYYQQAIPYLASAARGGHARAAAVYAYAMLTGRGMEANPTDAVAMLRDWAESDTSGLAHSTLGVAYLAGIGVPVDTSTAATYFTLGAAMGNAVAMRQLAAIAASQDDTASFMHWLQEGSKAGDVESLNTLGRIYLEGDLVEKNATAAAQYFQLAADQGSLEGMCRLANCYEEGEGVVLNSRRAFNLYKQAAEAGSPYGMRMMAYCYSEGIFVEANEEKVNEWLLRAADAGDVHSCYLVGKKYASGDGYKKSKKKARHYLTLATEAGHAEAAQALQEL